MSQSVISLFHDQHRLITVQEKFKIEANLIQVFRFESTFNREIYYDILKHTTRKRKKSQ